MLDSDLGISEFELQSRSYVHFQTNAFGKGMKPLYTSINTIRYYHCCSSTREPSRSGQQNTPTVYDIKQSDGEASVKLEL